MRIARWRGAAVPILLVAISALLFGAAFPPLRWRILGWVALAPLFVALRRSGPATSLLLAWLWSVLAAYSVGDWMPRAIETYYQQPAWVGWAFFLGVATVMGAPYYAVFAWAYRSLATRAVDFGVRAWIPLLAAATWAAIELARGRLFTETTFFIGNPWALAGYSQLGWAPVVQVASITGVYGISFAMAAANAALAETWISREWGWSAWRMAAAGALPGFAILIFGSLIIARAPMPNSGEGEPVLVVQANLATGSRWRSDLYGRNLETYMRMTLEGAREERPSVVFWPESSMTFFVDREEPYRRSIASVLVPLGAELIAGGVRWEGPEGAPRYFNTIFSLEPRGRVQGRYDKVKLVPFGEYFPLRSVEMLRRRFERVRVLTPGGAPSLLPSALGPLAIATCNEAMLPELVAKRVALGAAVIINPSNDTWIPEKRFAEQQLDIVTLRAIEQRRPLVRSSTTGPSAVIDPYGRILGRTQMGERATLHARIRPTSGASLYSRIGDTFGLACAALVAAVLLLGRRPA